jgi:PPOX class probable F420-dependent enzyme
MPVKPPRVGRDRETTAAIMPFVPKMTEEEWRAFVLEGTRTGKLSVVRYGSRPHVVPVWFVLDGDDVVFTTGLDTVKGRALRRHGRAAMCVDDDRPPFSFVTIEGDARLSTDPADLRTWATTIAARYMGAAHAEAIGARNATPGEVVVRIRVDKVIAERDIAA